MNNLETTEFNGHIIPLIKHNSDAWFTARDIAECLEYKDGRRSILKLYKRHKTELEEYSGVVKLTTHDGSKQDARVFNEEGVMIITMLSKQPKAATFRRWAVGVLKDYRHNQLQPDLSPDQMIISKDDYIHMLKEKIEFLQKDQPRKRRPFTDQEKDQIMALHQQGKTSGVIGRKFDRNPSSIRGLITSLEGLK